MGDPGFVSGFIGVGIDTAIHQIIHHINIALRCKKELANLKGLVMEIERILKEIQHYRLDLNSKKISIPQSNNKLRPSAVNTWLKKLDVLLGPASAMAHQCSTISKYDVISRYRTSRRITRLISDVREHLQSVPLISMVQNEELQERLSRIEELCASPASASTSATATQPDASRGFFINEPHIVGQDKAVAALEKSVMEAEAESSFSRIGVLGKGGSGKTLLLKTVFNKVREFFSNGLLLWLTVSQSPSFTNLRNQLSSQIAMQENINLDQNMNEEAIKIWLHESMKGKRFVFFLDDVWEEGGKLLEELGLLRLTDHSTSKIVVSSRNQKALLEMGVNPDKSTLIKIGDLMEDDSWWLFRYHAFPHNDGNLPVNIDEGKARVVCTKCGGLPLAIKAVARAMAGIIDAQEWNLAVQRLSNANGQDLQGVYDCLRLSYDAMGNCNINLQLCFLYLAAAFPEDQIVDAEIITTLWLGEGLLQDQGGHDQFEIGRIYVNNLADRCLLEPAVRYIDGSVQYFRMHDVVRSWGIQIAKQEENFYSDVGKGLKTLDANECLGRNRILLSCNQLTFLPKSFRAPEICTLTLAGNSDLGEIPRRVIKSMISLKVLDLSRTSIQSLPESIGCLKQLAYLALMHVPIKSLPASVSKLANLQVLALYKSGITKLPLGIHKLRALRYLTLAGCDDLQYLPRGISQLTSLQHLSVSSSAWSHRELKRGMKAASINDLGNLTELKYLRLENNGETICEGILGRMLHMETLQLSIKGTPSLPEDIINMSMLKKFSLESSHIVKMENRFDQFQNLNHLKLMGCEMLEELPQLQNLRGLRKLEIVRCEKLKRIPKEFGEKGAFPMLKTFSMVALPELEELPMLQDGAMSKLENLTSMMCVALMRLPKCYWNLKNLRNIRLYGCSKILEILATITRENPNVKVVKMSTTTAMALFKKFAQEEKDDPEYGEFWNREYYLFLQEIFRYF